MMQEAPKSSKLLCLNLKLILSLNLVFNVGVLRDLIRYFLYWCNP